MVNGRGPQAQRLVRLDRTLHRQARQPVAWMDDYRAHHGNAALTCRYFGISRQTVYR